MRTCVEQDVQGYGLLNRRDDFCSSVKIVTPNG
jgi:hypothetical protein